MLDELAAIHLGLDDGTLQQANTLEIGAIVPTTRLPG